MSSHKTAAIMAGTVIAAGTLIAIAQLGPLNPPSGAVSDTGPSLADLQSGTGLPGGLVEYEIFQGPLADSLGDQLSSTLIANGRVYIDSISTFLTQTTLFEGPGQLNSSGLSTSGTVAGRCASYVDSGGASYDTDTVQIGRVVTDPHVAWNQLGSFGFVMVRYIRLD
ncbi:MAG: hypothetical protein AAGI53_01195 [Planctomycetota bacterium]